MTEEQRDGGRYDERGAYGGGTGSPGAYSPGPQSTGPQSPGTAYPGYGAAGASWGGTATAERPAGPYPTATLPPAMVPTERPRRGRGMGAVVAAALIAGLVGGGAGFGGAYALLDDQARTPALGSVAASTGTAPASNGTVAGAAATAAPSTVDIRIVTSQGVAEGSGVILTADGAVLTNNHVVSGGNGTITVTLADGSEHTATVVGTSPSYDLAVLRMQNVSGLTAATLGRSADLQVGQQVVAIGSPQGLAGTVTSGIVSALNRTVGVQGDDGSAVVYNGLQTDAPINQGNSGGPLVNLDGQVIGINSAIATAGQSSGSIGLGFTIPIDQARRVAQEILDTGSATKPVLGVQGGQESRAGPARWRRDDRRRAERLGRRDRRAGGGRRRHQGRRRAGGGLLGSRRPDRLLRPRRQGHADGGERRHRADGGRDARQHEGRGADDEHVAEQQHVAVRPEPVRAEPQQNPFGN